MKESLEGMRGAAGPEVRAIMYDPIVLQVVTDFKANSAAAAAQMQNPEVAAKVQKLIDAGLIKL